MLLLVYLSGLIQKVSRGIISCFATMYLYKVCNSWALVFTGLCYEVMELVQGVEWLT